MVAFASICPHVIKPETALAVAATNRLFKKSGGVHCAALRERDQIQCPLTLVVAAIWTLVQNCHPARILGTA